MINFELAEKVAIHFYFELKIFSERNGICLLKDKKKFAGDEGAARD